MKREEGAIGIIDGLLGQPTGEEDALLDLRNALVMRENPGVCVEYYFKLRRRLSAWYRRDLEAIKGALESKIMLEIMASDERVRTCLGLGDQHQLEEYCLEQMKKTAEKFASSERINIRFCWC